MSMMFRNFSMGQNASRTSFEPYTRWNARNIIDLELVFDFWCLAVNCLIRLLRLQSLKNIPQSTCNIANIKHSRNSLKISVRIQLRRIIQYRGKKRSERLKRGRTLRNRLRRNLTSCDNTNRSASTKDEVFPFFNTICAHAEWQSRFRAGPLSSKKWRKLKLKWGVEEICLLF